MKPLAVFMALVCLASSAVAGDVPEGSDSGYDVFYVAEDRLVTLRFRVLIDGEPAEKVWGDFLNRRFGELDSDNDGVLTGDEQRGLPSVDFLAQLGMIARQPQNSNLLIDLDPRDGRISPDEFTVWCARIGLESFRVRIMSEQAEVQPRPAAPQQIVEASRALFQALDADGDHQVALADFRQATHRVMKFDLDRDESISVAELTSAGSVSQRSGWLNRAVPPRFVYVSPVQPRWEVAQQLRGALDRRGKSLGTTDNRLSCDELGLPAEKIAPFDADGDGALDFEELQQFIVRPPVDIEVVARLGITRGGPPLELVGQPGLVVGKAQMEFATGRTSYANPRAQPIELEEPVSRLFQSFDRDANGYFDAAEAQRFGVNASIFAIMDADRDEKVFRPECLAFYTPLVQMSAARVQLEVSERGHELFRILDANGDAQIIPREFQAAASRVVDWDSNGDGLLALEEIPLQLRLVVDRNVISPFASFLPATPAVAPSSGVRARSTAGPAWFTNMDRNGDGDVSPREFLGPPELFSKLDTDSDGLLSASEASSAAKDNAADKEN